MPKNTSDALLTSLTPGQRNTILTAVGEELSNIYPSEATDIKDGQRLIRRMGDFKAAAHRIIIEIGGMRYRSERVPSTYSYPAGFAVRPVCEQLLALKDIPLFQRLNSIQAHNCSKTMVQLPEDADGNLVTPWWGLFGKTYAEATEKVIQELIRVYNLKNWLDGHLTEKHLRLYEHTRLALEAIHQKQPGDFLVFPAQFGILHRGDSVRLVRDILLPKEFGLGPFEGGVAMLSHPELVSEYESLWMDLPGAEYDYDAAGRFPNAPYFSFYDGQRRFYNGSVSGPGERVGSASAFSPQQ